VQDGAVEVVEIKDRRVVLRGGEVIEDVDALLMGTGFTAHEYDPAFGITDKTEWFMKASTRLCLRCPHPLVDVHIGCLQEVTPQ
jgi:hypothetical protein